LRPLISRVRGLTAPEVELPELEVAVAQS
jgi:hypothetical protein